jgi:hypothetical protein
MKNLKSNGRKRRKNRKPCTKLRRKARKAMKMLKWKMSQRKSLMSLKRRSIVICSTME